MNSSPESADAVGPIKTEVGLISKKLADHLVAVDSGHMKVIRPLTLEPKSWAIISSSVGLESPLISHLNDPCGLITVLKKSPASPSTCEFLKIKGNSPANIETVKHTTNTILVLEFNYQMR